MANKLLFFVVLIWNSIGLAEFNVVSWNAKHLGRKNQDLESSAKLLTQGDLIAIQEVNTSESGKLALGALTALLAKNTGLKYCHAYSEIPTDGKERYGVIWKEEKIQYVTTKGEVISSCPNYAITLRLGSQGAEKIIREPAVGVFLEKETGKKFHFATIHLVPTSKKPELEVPHLFDTIEALQGKYGRLVVGDFNLGSDHPAFDAARQKGYSPLFTSAVKTSLKAKKRDFNQPYDNMWGKGLTFKNGKVWDVYKEFSQFSTQKVYKEISDHAPIEATINLE